MAQVVKWVTESKTLYGKHVVCSPFLCKLQGKGQKAIKLDHFCWLQLQFYHEGGRVASQVSKTIIVKRCLLDQKPYNRFLKDNWHLGLWRESLTLSTNSAPSTWCITFLVIFLDAILERRGGEFQSCSFSVCLSWSSFFIGCCFWALYFHPLACCSKHCN